MIAPSVKLSQVKTCSIPSSGINGKHVTWHEIPQLCEKHETVETVSRSSLCEHVRISDLSCAAEERDLELLCLLASSHIQ